MHGEVTDTPIGPGFTTIASGPYQGYALRADGSIAAWGHDDTGQVSQAPSGTGFTAIAAGQHHAYALRADGSVAAWGHDASGQVSDAPLEKGFVAIAAGEYHGYALRADGSIAAWGSDGYWQVSGAPAGAGFAAIAGGSIQGYALLPAAIRFEPRKGSLQYRPYWKWDRFALVGSAGFDHELPGGVAGLPLQALAVELGSSAHPWTLTIPADDPGWKVTKRGITWRSPKGSLPRLSLALDTRRGTLKVRARKIRLPAGNSPFGLTLSQEDHLLLRWSAEWAVKSAPGAYAYKAP